MDLEARKIEFVEEFLKLQSEEAVIRLEKILKEEKESSEGKKLKKMSKLDLNTRIDRSLKDSEEGKLTELDALKSEIKKW